MTMLDMQYTDKVTMIISSSYRIHQLAGTMINSAKKKLPPDGVESGPLVIYYEAFLTVHCLLGKVTEVAAFNTI